MWYTILLAIFLVSGFVQETKWHSHSKDLIIPIHFQICVIYICVCICIRYVCAYEIDSLRKKLVFKEHWRIL